MAFRACEEKVSYPYEESIYMRCDKNSKKL